ncbi:MAG: hypothetical protein ACR2PL_01640 [Dehalococcoidia bacterium]
MNSEKVSVSLNPNLLAEARQRSRGQGTLSSYLNDALRRKILVERSTEYLDSLDVEFGPIQ